MTYLDLNEDILFYAFRYALGRQTYAVSDGTMQIKRNWKGLSANCQQRIKEEISMAIDKGHAGSEIDVRDWKSILDL